MSVTIEDHDQRVYGKLIGEQRCFLILSVNIDNFIIEILCLCLCKFLFSIVCDFKATVRLCNAHYSG